MSAPAPAIACDASLDSARLDAIDGSDRVLSYADAFDRDIDFVPDVHAVACVSEATARRFGVVPLSLDRAVGILCVAVLCVPDLPTHDHLRRELPEALQLTWQIVPAGVIARRLDSCYGAGPALQQLASACGSGLVDSPPIIALIDALLIDAVSRRASDIHIGPSGAGIRVRYRVDGVLDDIVSLPRCHLEAVTVRLKVLAGADIAETRRPQDGQFDVTLNGCRLDFRFSCFPLSEGENIVLRVIERRDTALDLAALAQPTPLQRKLRALVTRPDGLIVVCGPTGSGKTTTLYALLGELDATALNIMALEDPVEHSMPGICQASIDPARGLDFASGVRSLLRQDPDVLLIGEIRDADSCAMALRAALTGHLVLTTVHASDAVSAIGRLCELGAEPGVLADVLSAVVAQRLLRMCCVVCRGRTLASPCPHCRGKGLRGRRAVLEVLEPGNRFATGIRRGVGRSELTRLAAEQGHECMGIAADRLVRDGITTGAERLRIMDAQAGNTKPQDTANEAPGSLQPQGGRSA